MLDWTDRHCRVFHRLLSKKAWLYSEMVTTGAIIYGNNLPRFLGFDSALESPVVLQLGGSKATELADCAVLAQKAGYAEVNLNVGCPSDRVQNNLMGACLMAHPKLVAEGVLAMKEAVSIPVTVKTRIGIDEQEDFELLVDFVAGLVDAGLDGLIVHARKAWLQGLSPKQNREIPPLKYDWVHRLKAHFSDLPIAINGGIATPQAGLVHLAPFEGHAAVDGVMLGRAIYEQPYLLSGVDALYYGEASEPLSRKEVLLAMGDYIEAHLQTGGKLNHISRHMLGLFAGLPGGRMWRRYISQHAFAPGAGMEVLIQAYEMVEAEQQRMVEQHLASERYHQQLKE